MANPHPAKRIRSREREKTKDVVATAAIVTLHRPGAMTPEGRKDIAAWLRKTATDFLKHGAQYNDTGRFVARYVYSPED